MHGGMSGSSIKSPDSELMALHLPQLPRIGTLSSQSSDAGDATQSCPLMGGRTSFKKDQDWEIMILLDDFWMSRLLDDE